MSKKSLGLFFIMTLASIAFLRTPKNSTQVDQETKVSLTSNEAYKSISIGAKQEQKWAEKETEKTSIPQKKEAYQYDIEIKNDHKIWMNDIIIGPDDSNHSIDSSERAVQIWPERVIPYENNLATEPKRVRHAVGIINRNTIVQFVERTIEDDYVSFEDGEGCSSYAGKVGGKQEVFLSADCSTGNILHELLHVLGLYHEQNRPDRDNFLLINWENISPEFKSSFTKLSSSYYPYIDSNFDYESVTMYGSYSSQFAKDEYSPILLNIDGTAIKENRAYLSKLDIERIRAMYDHAVN